MNKTADSNLIDEDLSKAQSLKMKTKEISRTKRTRESEHDDIIQKKLAALFEFS